MSVQRTYVRDRARTVHLRGCPRATAAMTVWWAMEGRSAAEFHELRAQRPHLRACPVCLPDPLPLEGA